MGCRKADFSSHLFSHFLLRFFQFHLLYISEGGILGCVLFCRADRNDFGLFSYFPSFWSSYTSRGSILEALGRKKTFFLSFSQKIAS